MNAWFFVFFENHNLEELGSAKVLFYAFFKTGIKIYIFFFNYELWQSSLQFKRTFMGKACLFTKLFVQCKNLYCRYDQHTITHL